VDYAAHKQRQFDILADTMREHIDIERLYHMMNEYQEEVAG